MKIQGLFSSKDKSKTIKCRLLQFLFGALRVNVKLEHFANVDAAAATPAVNAHCNFFTVLAKYRITFTRIDLRQAHDQ